MSSGDPLSLCIVECNDRCACDVQLCQLRTSQRGVTVPLEVFATSSKGWGVRPRVDLPAGTFVCVYVGEIISRAEATRRHQMQTSLGLDNYILTLKEHCSDGRVLVTCIDARLRGNVGRMVNHSCDPNLDIRLVRFSFIPIPALYTNRDVPAGTELTFSYGSAPRSVSPLNKPCLCGSDSCCGTMPYEA